MTLSRVLRPAWSFAALGLALSLLALPMAARAQDDDDDDNGDRVREGTIRIYGSDDADAGKGGYLGVQVQDVTRALQRARNLPTDEGALVSRVEDESPADRNGIRRGDVITELDREKIDDSQDLIRAVRKLEAGSRVRITLWRSGSLRTVNVELGERPKGMTPGMGMPNFRVPNDDDHRPMTPPEMPGMNDRNVRRQIRELQDQLKELRQEIQSLRREMRRSGDDNDRRSRDRNDDDEDDD